MLIYFWAITSSSGIIWNRVVIINSFFHISFYPASNMILPHCKVKYEPRIHKRSWRWKLCQAIPCSLISMSSTTQFHHAVEIETDVEIIDVVHQHAYLTKLMISLKNYMIPIELPSATMDQEPPILKLDGWYQNDTLPYHS